MATVTAPIMTDATGQSIDSKLNSLLGKMDNLAAAFQPNASGIVYSNTTSGLTGDDVQEAIDEMAADVSEIKSSLSNLHLQYDTLLNNQDTTTTETSYSLSSGKKFSDYQILIFEQRYDVSDTRYSMMVQGIGWVTGRVLYLNCLHGSTAASASTYNVSGITVKYNSDTSFKAQATGAAGVKKVSVFGIKLSN